MNCLPAICDWFLAACAATLFGVSPHRRTDVLFHPNHGFAKVLALSCPCQVSTNPGRTILSKCPIQRLHDCFQRPDRFIEKFHNSLLYGWFLRYPLYLGKKKKAPPILKTRSGYPIGGAFTQPFPAAVLLTHKVHIPHPASPSAGVPGKPSRQKRTWGWRPPCICTGGGG